MSYGYSRPTAELEKREPTRQKSFVNLSAAIERAVYLTVAYEIGRAVYGLGTMNRPRLRGASKATYRRLCLEEAARAGFTEEQTKLLMSRSGRREIVSVRWLVWRTMRDRGASYPAIERVSGHDHSTIIYGLRRLDGVRAEICRKGYRHWTNNPVDNFDVNNATGPLPECPQRRMVAAE